MENSSEIKPNGNTVSLLAEAKKLREAGFTVLPVRAGEKRPAVKTWSEYQTRPMADRELERFREAVL